MNLKESLRRQLLGDRLITPEEGKVQCPFCSEVFTPTEPEHHISNICNPCWDDTFNETEEA